MGPIPRRPYELMFERLYKKDQPLDAIHKACSGNQGDMQLACGSRGLIIDLTELSFLGCAGILVLLHAREAAQRKKVPLQLVCNSPAVLRILKLSDVLDRFALSPTLHDALGRATQISDQGASVACR